MPNQVATQGLSHKETRQIVTPYAFHVSPELFGTALASPTKRGIAIGLDLLLVALLSQAASFLLAGVAALTFFRAGNRLKLKKRFNRGRLALRFLAAVFLFVFALGIFEAFNDGFGSDSAMVADSGKLKGGIETVVILGISADYMQQASNLSEQYAERNCQDAMFCWQQLGDEFVTQLAEIQASPEKSQEVLQGFVEISSDQLDKTQRGELLTHLTQQLSEKSALTSKMVDKSAPEQEAIDSVLSLKEQIISEKDQEERQSSGVIAWIKSILEDLGLGFGWAAFYFCIFTAWWHGQTPGKKLVGIKVIKLDGSGPNLWESFGRYGGYGAGLATGLLGFLQVYWDPNRQAIQDKISETLVIDVTKVKVPFVPSGITDTVSQSDSKPEAAQISE
jgi:hypothetical protein